MIPMRDSVKLAADIYVPDAEEGKKFPALLAYGIWNKEYSSDLQWKYPPQPPPSFLWSGSAEAGNSEYLVSRGYVHVLAQIRGVAHSEGLFEDQYQWVSRPSDAYDVVEWVAEQPWCDGNVGMVGISAFGASQLWAAIQKPPHLKAIFPYDTPGDLYRDGFYDGGMLSLLPLSLMPAANGYDPKKREERRKIGYELRAKMRSMSMSGSESESVVASGETTEDDFLLDYALKDYFGYTKLFNILVHPNTHPMMFNLLMNQFDGEVYRAKSYYPSYDKIAIPVYCGTGWYSIFYHHMLGAFRNYEGLGQTSKAVKLIMGPDAHGPGDRWFHLERPWHEYHDEMVRWYDYWLKGKNTGIMDEPPIKLFVMGANRWRYENEWPLARTEWRKFYLRSFKRLMEEEEPASTETTPDAFVQQPLNTTNDIAKLEYQTAPLSQDLEITGPIAANLYGSINTENRMWVDANWIICVKDVFENGVERDMTKGWLRASHRAIDPKLSKPYRPYHPHTREALEKLEVDKIYEFPIEVRPTSNVFKAGHRIKVEIFSAELPALLPDLAHHVTRNDVVLHKVYRSKKHPSHLLLPVIRETSPSQWLDRDRAKYLPSLSDGTASTRTRPNAY